MSAVAGAAGAGAISVAVVEAEVPVAADVHAGTSPEMVGVVGVVQGAGVVQGVEVGVEAAAVVCVETARVAESVSAKMAMLAGLEVGWMEGKTRPCAAFNVGVAGQNMNTMQGVSSNSGVGTRVCLTPQVGAGV